MTAIALLVARCESARLPGKVLASVVGKPMIQHLIERLQAAELVDGVVLCTTPGPADDALVAVARRCEAHVFRGNEHNVAARCAGAAADFGATICVIAEGDEAVADPAIVDRIVEAQRATGADGVVVEDAPYGTCLLGVSATALEELASLAGDADGWGRFLTETGRFRVERLRLGDPRLERLHPRLTLDYPDDLELVRAVYERLYKPGQVFTLNDVLSLLEAEPGLLELNAAAAERYAEHVGGFPAVADRLAAVEPTPTNAGTVASRSRRAEESD